MKHFVLATVLGLALIALLVSKLPAVWKLNQVALQTASFMTAAGLTPDWWIEMATPSSCAARPPYVQPLPAGRATTFAGRASRLHGLVALVCGDDPQAAALFQAAEDDATVDPTLPLLLSAASASPEHPSGTDVPGGPANWGVALEQARKAYEQGDSAAAVRQLDLVQAAIAEPAQPDRRALYFWACFIYRGARQLESSLGACQHLVEVSPENKEAWNSLGLTFMAQRKWPEAEQAFGRAVALDESWTPASVGLGRALAAQDRKDEARRYFEAVLTNEPDEPWSNYQLAVYALEAGQCAQARTYAEVAARSENARLATEAQKFLDTKLQACK